jgi:hypothetical protein
VRRGSSPGSGWRTWSPLYLAAQDIAMCTGTEQGLILAPEHEAERAKPPTDGSRISVTQAAELIGITRAAVYKAFERDALRALRLGNVTVVDRASALAYKAARREAPPRRRTTTTRS